MQLKNHVMPPARPKAPNNIGAAFAEAQFQDDSWLNDAGSISQSKSPEEGRQRLSLSPAKMISLLERTLPASQAKAYIGHGHPLWPVVLRLSEHIWHELFQKPDAAPISEPILIELVQKRALDLLRSELTFANLVHDLAAARSLLHSIMDEVLGFGPLETLLKDDNITEILGVGPRQTYIERNGMLEEMPCSFEDERHMARIIENMLRQAGQRMKPNRSIIDMRLPGGALVNVVLPPSAVNGPTITIRKCAKEPLTLNDLVEGGSMTREMADFLRACVQGRLNIVICGTLSAGRTTLLNALCSHIPTEERIVTIEDTVELRLGQKHVIALASQLTGPQNTGRVTLRDLVINALRMGPERILLGECRGDETVEMLQAMYTGYNGSLMTAYGKNARDCLARLETMCLASDLNFTASIIKSQIAGALDMIVHVSRLPDGSRKIVNIAEVQAVENDTIKLKSIFYYRDAGLDAETGKVKGTFEPSGFCPKFLAKFEVMDIHVPREMFKPSHAL